jgi:Uma2 family endonuclease
MSLTMTAALKRMTPEEYLDRERLAETKSEFVDGQIIAMAGANWPHNLVNENLSYAFGSRLIGTPCRSLSRDLRVRSESTRSYFYPDLVIVCGPPVLEGNDVLLNPTVLVEVLSPSTEGYDRGAKFRHYRSIPSLKEYILVTVNAAVIDRYLRLDDGSWSFVPLIGIASELQLDSIPVRIPLSEIYRDVLAADGEVELP